MGFLIQAIICKINAIKDVLPYYTKVFWCLRSLNFMTFMARNDVYGTIKSLLDLKIKIKTSNICSQHHFGKLIIGSNVPRIKDKLYLLWIYWYQIGHNFEMIRYFVCLVKITICKYLHNIDLCTRPQNQFEYFLIISHTTKFIVHQTISLFP